MRTLLCVLCALAAGAAAPEPLVPLSTDELVVLGIDGGAGLSTWAVDAAGVRRIGAGVLVPPADARAPWRTIDRFLAADGAIVLVPFAGRAPALEPAGALAGEPGGRREQVLHFAGPGFYSFARAPCEPDCVFVTSRYGEGRPGAPLRIDRALGAAARTAWRAALGACAKPAGGRCRADDAEFALVRVTGGWRLLAVARRGPEPCNPVYDQARNVTVDLELPSAAVGAEPNPRRRATDRFDRGVRDRVRVPGGVLEERERPDGGRDWVWAVAGRAPVVQPSPGRLVQVRRAQGAEAARWRERLAASPGAATDPR